MAGEGESMMIGIAVLAAAIASASHHSASQHTQMPPGMTHEEHMQQLEKEAELKKHGAAAMGFDQDAARHEFKIEPDGGSIAVDVKDAADLTTRDAIRAHLREIADAFSKGDFSKPLQTHAEVPPGVPVMTDRKERITYSCADTPHGAIVRIRTRDAQALDAIHAFLNYQIREHRPPIT